MAAKKRRNDPRRRDRQSATLGASANLTEQGATDGNQGSMVTNGRDSTVTAGTRRWVRLFAVLCTSGFIVAGIGWMMLPPSTNPQASRERDQSAAHDAITDRPLQDWQTYLTSIRVADDADPTAGPDRVQDTASPLADGYIGSQACRKCHQEQFDGHYDTTHGRSARWVDLSVEPSPGDVPHPASRRRYRVEHREGQMLHIEELLARDGSVVATTEAPIAFSIGSGLHAMTYLMTRDDRFYESPLTWFAKPNAWRMSPGYDGPGHSAFRRPVDVACVYCHVGSIHQSPTTGADGQSNRFSIIEPAIGCERCHGPGQDHVAIYDAKSSGQAVSQAWVDRIVHPGQLSRERSEAICQQCHLQTPVLVAAADSSVWDFRPGQLITENHGDYYCTGDGAHRVVGHVQQMRDSRCWQQSETLTCISCHPPHRTIQAKERLTFYRDSCLQCHDDAACGVGHPKRLAANSNDCAACHMPKQDTNISHAALHHHRIGIHGDNVEEEKADERKAGDGAADTDASDDIRAGQGDGKLVRMQPVLPVDALTKTERDRREFLAARRYVAMAQGNLEFDADRSVVNVLKQQIRQATNRRLRSESGTVMDVETLLALSGELAAADQRQGALQMAQRALQNAVPGSFFAGQAHQAIGMDAMLRQQFSVAVPHLRQANEITPTAIGHYNLGVCLLNMGDARGGVQQLERALLLRPDDPLAHDVLATVFEVSDPTRSALHRRVASRLRETQ